jgi:hypothetical protein
MECCASFSRALGVSQILVFRLYSYAKVVLVPPAQKIPRLKHHRPAGEATTMPAVMLPTAVLQALKCDQHFVASVFLRRLLGEMGP